jgi:sec-independent protein translocase protein TatA
MPRVAQRLSRTTPPERALRFTSKEDHSVFEGLFQPTHLLLILLIALIIFGPRRLPELGRSLGTAIRDFKQGLTATSAPPTETPRVEGTPETRASDPSTAKVNSQPQ